MMSIVIILLQGWLILLNKQVFKNSEISIHLSSVQQASHAVHSDLVLLRDYLANNDQESINQYILLKMPLHKQWLKEIIYGQNDLHPLVIFSESYLRLLKGVQIEAANEGFTTRLDLFELIDNITQEKNNIAILSKQRSQDNYNQLKNNIIAAELVAVVLLILFVFYIFSRNINYRRQKKRINKAQKLALFFVDYPNALVRLSSSGRVRYYNKQASALMDKLKLNRSQLIPGGIKQKLDKVVKRPNKVVRFTHCVDEVALYCDIRLSPDSGQIYMMVSETKQDPSAMQPIMHNDLEAANEIDTNDQLVSPS